jgi:hypothetical protein
MGSDEITIITPLNNDRNLAYAVTSPSAAPDAVFYTSCYPDSSAASYIPFAPMPSDVGGAEPFSFALAVRIQSFGSWIWPLNLGNISGQQIFKIDDGSNHVEIFIWQGPQGFSISFGYSNYGFQYTNLAVCGQWMHLAFTWDGKTASTYLNGSPLSGEPVAVKMSKPTCTIGMNATNPPNPRPGQTQQGPFIGDVLGFSLWQVCLSASEIQQQMWRSPSAPLYLDKILAGYDFTTNPPTKVGTGPNATPTNTVARGNAPALASWGMDVATPGQASNFNPGGSAPFSVLGWIFVGNDGQGAPQLNGYLFSNGASGDPRRMGLKLVNGTLVGEVGVTTVTSAIAIAGYQWIYVAFTFDGTKGTLYVNNTAAGSAPMSGTSLAKGAPKLFGAVDATGTPIACFQGYIQFLSVWKKCLTATEVAQQADTDPTLDGNCVANFMCPGVPCRDSIAISVAGVTGTEQILLGRGFFFGRTYLLNSKQAQGNPEPAEKQRTAGQLPLDLSGFKCPGPFRAATAEIFSEAHKRLMVDELKYAASSLLDQKVAERWTQEFEDEIDRVFALARTSPKSLDGPHVSYELVDGEYRLIYYPDGTQKIDLGISVDINSECTVWWASFTLTTILGVLAIFGVNTPIDDLTTLAGRIVTDPVVIETCTTVVGFTLTASTMLSFCKVLYDFGYLGQAFWLCASKVGWWGTGKLIVYFAGCFSPVPTPAKALFIANTAKLVGQLTLQLMKWKEACGSGDCVGDKV